MVDADRVLHMGADQVGHGFFDSGGEKKSLPAFRHVLQDLLERRQEAHVQHAVRFIQNQHAYAAQLDQFPVEEIAQASRRRNDDLRALADIAQLGGFIHAAHSHRGMRRFIPCISLIALS